MWRAEDTKLGRDVAIKMLLGDLADDPKFLARLEREAKVLASINHPNIATIYSLEQSGTVRFLVLELVPGKSLKRLLTTGPPPSSRGLQICEQIARALEAAHREGIVHRDLKPANVKRTDGGEVKVLDFGLAKALDPATGVRGHDGIVSPDLQSPISMSPTLTAQMTGPGIILGTAAFMSPEQARGQEVDIPVAVVIAPREEVLNRSLGRLPARDGGSERPAARIEP